MLPGNLMEFSSETLMVQQLLHHWLSLNSDYMCLSPGKLSILPVG
jgi:hypothetical protein